MSEQYFTRPNIQPVITYIGTTPEQRQMSTDEFKAKFDEMTVNLQNYIKETLLTELDAFKQEFMTHQADFATHEHNGSNTLKINWDNIDNKPDLLYMSYGAYVVAGASHTIGDLPAGVYLASSSRSTAGGAAYIIIDGVNSIYKIHGDGQQGTFSYSGNNLIFKAHVGGGETIRIYRL